MTTATHVDSERITEVEGDFYDAVPPRGLPGPLPADEVIAWQGSPNWWQFGCQVYLIHWLTGYFVLIAAWSVFQSMQEGASLGAMALAAVPSLSFGLMVVGLFALLAFFGARAAIYTITNKRVMLEVGIALTKNIDIPYKAIRSVELQSNSRGVGNLAFHLKKERNLPYFVLWPFARPWEFRDPQPMLRAIPDVNSVAEELAERLRAALPLDKTDSMSEETEEVAGPIPALPVQDRVGLAAAAVILCITIGGAAYVSLTGATKPGEITGSPISVYNLGVTADSDDRLTIKNLATMETVTVVEPGREGLIRGALRGIAYARKAYERPADASVQLIFWDDGRLTLSDESIGHHMPLDAFGRPDRGALNDLLKLPGGAS
ncbi:MAG: photosynthetic complex putative assembly protein PuhB [Pseudomonadota bacterium]